jgi:hypothetical protein
MIRKTLTIFSLIGLLLSAGLWGVSYLNVYHDAPHIGGTLAHGCWGVWYVPESHHRGMGVWYDGFNDFTTSWIPFWERKKPAFEFVLPLWLPTLLFSFLFVWGAHPLSHLRRRKRKKLGLCVKCGYNLRGLTEPRCPECNTLFEERLLKKDT